MRVAVGALVAAAVLAVTAFAPAIAAVVLLSLLAATRPIRVNPSTPRAPSRLPQTSLRRSTDANKQQRTSGRSPGMKTFLATVRYGLPAALLVARALVGKVQPKRLAKRATPREKVHGRGRSRAGER